jgi:hypothetical protein
VPTERSTSTFSSSTVLRAVDSAYRWDRMESAVAVEVASCREWIAEPVFERRAGAPGNVSTAPSATLRTSLAPRVARDRFQLSVQRSSAARSRDRMQPTMRSLTRAIGGSTTSPTSVTVWLRPQPWPVMLRIPPPLVGRET